MIQQILCIIIKKKILKWHRQIVVIGYFIKTHQTKCSWLWTEWWEKDKMGGEPLAACMPFQWKYVLLLIAIAAAAAAWWHCRRQMDGVLRGKWEASQTLQWLAVLQIISHRLSQVSSSEKVSWLLQQKWSKPGFLLSCFVATAIVTS